MPEWNAEDRDTDGFPTQDGETMPDEVKMKYLLDEIQSLHERIASLETAITNLVRELKE